MAMCMVSGISVDIGLNIDVVLMLLLMLILTIMALILMQIDVVEDTGVALDSMCIGLACMLRVKGILTLINIFANDMYGMTITFINSNGSYDIDAYV